MIFNSIVRFFKTEFGFAQENNLYKVYRLYFLLGSLFTPFIAFVLYKNNPVRNTYIDLSIMVIFSGFLVLSFYYDKIKYNLKQIFFSFSLLITTYTFYNLFSGNYNTDDFIGFTISYFAIATAILDHRFSFLYSIFTLVLIFVAGLIKPVGEISPLILLTIVFLVGLIAFIIHYNRHLLLKKLIENKSELEASQGRLLTVLDSIDNVVYNVSIDDRGVKTLRYISSTVDDVLGLSVDEYITEMKSGRIVDRIHPEDLPGVIEKSQILIKQVIPVSMVYRFKRNDNYIWIEEKVFPKQDFKGKHIASIGISTNVTGRVLNEISLKKSEERYRTMIERNLAGFYRIDLKNNLIDCNNAFSQIFGFSTKEEIIGKNINEIYSDSSDKNKFIDLLKEKHVVLNHESEIKLNSGKTIWLLENVSLVNDAYGKELFVEGTAFDITQLKNAQLEISSIQDNLALVINNIDSLVYSIDIDQEGNKSFNFLGPQIETIIGIERDKYIDLVKDGTISKFFHPDDLEEVKNKLQEVKKSKSIAQFTYRFWSENKQDYLWLEETMFPQFNQDGKIYKNFGVVRDVSEKQKYEAALIKSEESYRNLFERNLAGVFRTNTEGSIIDCNDAFVHIFGYESKEDIFQVNSKNLYYTNSDRQVYIQQLNEFGILSNYEIKMKRKDGSAVWILANVTLQEDLSNREKLLIGTLIDITELKKTEKALQENEEKFRLLFEVASDAILILEDHKIIESNLGASEVFLTSRNDLLGKTLLDLSPVYQPNGNPSIDRLQARVKKALAGDTQFFYWKNLRKDLVEFDSEISLISFRLGGKQLLQVIIRDITQRMKAEKALRESEERFKLLANATIEGIIFSENNIIIDSNEQFALMHGFESRKDIIGKSILDFVHPLDRDLILQRLQSNHEELVEIRAITKTGTTIWLDSKGKAIPYGSRQVRVSVVNDITPRKLFEEGLINSKKAYEQLVEDSPYGIFIHKEGNVLYANRSAISIMGFSLDSFIPNKYNMYDFLLPEYVEDSYNRRKRLFKGESIPFVRVKIKNIQGVELDIETKSQLINYNDEQVIQTTFKDISAELLLEKETIRAELAEMANKQLEEEINQHKITQEKLVAIQQYTAGIIGSSIDMIMATDIHNIINEINPAAEKAFGYTKEELFGLDPRVLYASEEDFLKVKTALETTGNFTGEILNKRKNGEVFTSYISASLIRNNRGKIVGTMGVSRDISEIIEAEQILKEQNAKIKSIFENSSNMLIWTIDKDFRLTSFNRNFKELFESKFDIQVAVGIDFLAGLKKAIAPDQYEKSKQRYKSALSGEPQDIEGYLINKHGEKMWFETFLNPIIPDRDGIEEISCVSHEITDKKIALLELRKSEDQNKAIINALPDLIFRVNSEGRYLDVVFKHEHALWVEPEKLVGKYLSDYYGNELGEQLLNKVKQVLNTKDILAFEFFVIENEQSEYYEARFGTINEEEVLVIIRNITESKQAEQDLKNSLHEKEILLKEVHHRVKNNLQVISSILNLQSSYVKEESTLQILQESQNRIKSMSFIHESLYQTKNFSYINFSEYIINLSKNLVHSYQVYEDLVDLNLEVEPVNLNLDQSIPCGLIVNELLSNALKYAFQQGQKGLITIGLREDKNKVFLRVEDNGKGLPEGFYATATETLGLQLVSTLVEQLDGTMGVKSNRNGTKYLITFEKLKL